MIIPSDQGDYFKVLFLESPEPLQLSQDTPSLEIPENNICVHKKTTSTSGVGNSHTEKKTFSAI